MNHYFTTANMLRYKDVLPLLVCGYNASKHHSIGMAPKDVTLKRKYFWCIALFESEFPSNQANAFKIRLTHPLPLPGIGWQVGLASISLPNARADLSPLTYLNEDNVVMTSHWSKQKPGKTGLEFGFVDAMEVDVKCFLQHILEKKQKKSRYFLRKHILAEKPLPE